jgi:hypothetical protein
MCGSQQRGYDCDRAASGGEPEMITIAGDRDGGRGAQASSARARAGQRRVRLAGIDRRQQHPREAVVLRGSSDPVRVHTLESADDPAEPQPAERKGSPDRESDAEAGAAVPDGTDYVPLPLKHPKRLGRPSADGRAGSPCRCDLRFCVHGRSSARARPGMSASAYFPAARPAGLPSASSED